MELTTDLPPALVPLAWLIGTWAGAGVGGYPTVEEFRFGQEVVFAHDGRPFLATAAAPGCSTTTASSYVRWPRSRGSGGRSPTARSRWRSSHPTGYSELWIGTVEGPASSSRPTSSSAPRRSKEYSAGHRLYGLVEGDLAWAFDMAAVGQPIQPHVSARLKRSG